MIHNKAHVIGSVTIDDKSVIDDFVFIYATEENPVSIGRYVHIASFVSISGGPVVIDDYACIGAGSRLLAGSDSFMGDALVGSAVPARYRKVRRAQITLRKHAVIGANCVIMPGVTIGTGACVGANSFVMRDVPAWTIVAGSPARFLRNRPSGIIKFLEKQLEGET